MNKRKRAGEKKRKEIKNQGAGSVKKLSFVRPHVRNEVNPHHDHHRFGVPCGCMPAVASPPLCHLSLQARNHHRSPPSNPPSTLPQQTRASRFSLTVGSERHTKPSEGAREETDTDIPLLPRQPKPFDTYLPAPFEACLCPYLPPPTNPPNPSEKLGPSAMVVLIGDAGLLGGPTGAMVMG